MRFLAVDDDLHPVVRSAISKIITANDLVVFTPQVSRESWAVLTRPLDVNGYGFSPLFVRGVLSDASTIFPFLPDTAEVYECWTELVTKYEVRGRQVHDAYHVAAMMVHRVPKVLTLDRRDFSRYEGIEVVFPEEI